MVGALLLITVGLPAGIWAANSFNSFLSGTVEYSQVENTTDFYDGPILDDDDEHRYASYNGTTVTQETPTWDVTGEWDQVTVVGTGSNNKLVLNWNMTTDDLLNSKFSVVRFKTNCSNELKLTVNAVKWDGVTLTSVEAYSVNHINNESETMNWNITPTKALELVNDLNPAATDEVYFQIVIEGYDSDNYLTVGDTVQFQIATGENGNVYSFSNLQILNGAATIFGLVFLLFGFASTPYWNPWGESKKRRR
jgi:hypothetical protein